MIKTYNGYRIYSAWNQSLWINKDKPLYQEALDLVGHVGPRKAATIWMSCYAGQKTPDGIAWNFRSVYDTFKELTE